MVDNFKCEKCGGTNIMSPVKMEHEYEDRSDDEYPQWVVESVKIGGAQVTAHVCLDCGRVVFSVDPTPLKLQLKREKEKVMAEQEKQKEAGKLWTEYNKAAYEYKEFEKKIAMLVKEEITKWTIERQNELIEINKKLQENQSKISGARSKLNALLQEQQKKQKTLKELGLSPENNPEIINKLVDQYEKLNESIKQLELEKRSLDAKINELSRRKFSESDNIKRNAIELESLKVKMETLSNKYNSYLKRR